MAKSSKVVRPVLYKHSSHAEWGHGIVVEENPKKVYLVFEDGARRPFVSIQKYRDMLVPAELAPELADEVIAKITKFVGKPAGKTPVKKKAKKVAAAPVEVEIPEEVGEEEGEDEESSEDAD